MRRILYLLIVLPLTFCCLAADTDDIADLVKRMARVGRNSSPSFSPDGKTLAFISDMNGTPQVWTVSTEGGWPRLVTAFDDPVTGLDWSPKGDWLAIVLAPGGGLNTQIYLVRPDGSEVKRLTPGGKENNWLVEWTHDGSALMVSSNLRGESMDSYLLYPSGEWKLVAKNPGVGRLSDVSRDGKLALVVRVKSRGDNDVILVDLASGNETNITPHEGPGSFYGLFARDGRTVYLITNKDRDLTAFGKVRLDTKNQPQSSEFIAERPDAELDGFILDEQGTTAVLVWNAGGKLELAFVDLNTEKSTPGPSMPGELVGGGDFSLDGTRLAVTVSGSTAPPDIWVMDMSTKGMRQVTFAPHAGINLSDLVRPQLLRYQADDGIELTGWLYAPKNWQGTGPVVLSFHGGPEGQEVPAFRSDYQALVMNGIAVFAPNVRGSSGFGKRFVNLDNGQLRTNAVHDIKATADFLIKRKIADPKRLGIMGGSYGGYMVMAGITEYPELFAAAANLFGIVNFKTFFEHTEPWMAAISTVEYGDPKTQADMLAALSPIHKLDRVKTPTIVLHGANDTNVPVVEAEQVANSLKQRGVPVNYVLFPDEGHGWRKIPNRIRSTVEIVNWFNRYLNPSLLQ